MAEGGGGHDKRVLCASSVCDCMTVQSEELLNKMRYRLRAASFVCIYCAVLSGDLLMKGPNENTSVPLETMKVTKDKRR